MLVTHGGIIDFFSRPLLAPAGGNGRDGPITINKETSFAHESHWKNGPALFISTSHVAEHHRSSPNPFTIFTSATPVYTCHTPQERQQLGIYPSTVSHPLILCSIAWFVFLEGCPSETLELSKLREVDTSMDTPKRESASKMIIYWFFFPFELYGLNRERAAAHSGFAMQFLS